MGSAKNEQSGDDNGGGLGPEREQDLHIEKWGGERSDVQRLLQEGRRHDRKLRDHVRLGFDPADRADRSAAEESSIEDNRPPIDNREIVERIRIGMRRRLAEAGVQQSEAQELIIRLVTLTTRQKREADPDTYSWVAIAAALNEITQHGYSVDRVRYLLFDVAGCAWLEEWVEIVRTYRERVEAQGRNPDDVIRDLLDARAQMREARLRSWSNWSDVVERIQCALR